MTIIHAHTIYQQGVLHDGRPLRVHEAESDGTIVISDTSFKSESDTAPRAYHFSADQAAALSDALWEVSGRRKPLSVREAEERLRLERTEAYVKGFRKGVEAGKLAARADIRKALGL